MVRALCNDNSAGGFEAKPVLGKRCLGALESEIGKCPPPAMWMTFTVSRSFTARFLVLASGTAKMPNSCHSVMQASIGKRLLVALATSKSSLTRCLHQDDFLAAW